MKQVAIVDAYSSGNLLAPLFAKEGVSAIHVQSSSNLPKFYNDSFQEKDFEESLMYSGDLSETLTYLKERGVDQVIAGTESGVELADQLSEGIGGLTNGTRLSEARRNKWKMVEALKAASVASIPSVVTREFDEAIAWARERYPVVVKPVKSAGTDSVTVCRSKEDLEENFRKLLGTTNRLGLLNETVLLQEFIEGTEYVVDTVSYESVMVVHPIYRYTKRVHHGAVVYDCVEMLSYEGKEQTILCAYAKEVLAALGIQYGPAHLEIMLTENGPVLIEIGARLDGARNPVLQKECLGRDQAELTVKCYLHGLSEEDAKPYEREKRALRVKLISDVSGKFKRFRYLAELKRLRSFFQFLPNIQPGETLDVTSSLFDLPGIVDLVHNDFSVIEADYRQIREWEEQGMYELR